ncbi:MAG: hypothetical protein PHE97_02035, partial [Candidatus Omnitrophica bacterium]|nr:hypothetical protein [Candidatus Omnitrophota bacterium]
MENRRFRKVRITLSLAAFFLLIFFSTIYAQSTGTNFTGRSASPTGSEEATEDIRQKHSQTQEAIENRKDESKRMAEEAVKAVEEKATIEKEAREKERAAILAKEELEAIKKEAKENKDPELLKRAKLLSKEVQQLEKDAAGSKEKLDLAESKAAAARQAIADNEAEIETLKKSLADLKREKSAKASFMDKAIMAAAIILLGAF